MNHSTLRFRAYRVVHRAMDLWLWVCILLWHWVLYGWKSETETGVLAIALGFFIFLSLKYILRRPRPLDPRIDLGIYKHDKYSFPSGHTLTGFAVATSLGKGHHWELFLLVPLAVGVGLSRWLLRLHYMVDVVAGAGFGIVVGQVVWIITH